MLQVLQVLQVLPVLQVLHVLHVLQVGAAADGLLQVRVTYAGAATARSHQRVLQV